MSEEKPILSPLFQPNKVQAIPQHVRNELENLLIPMTTITLTRIAQILRQYGGVRFDVSTQFGIDFGITRNEVPPVQPIPPPTETPPPPPVA